MCVSVVSGLIFDCLFLWVNADKPDCPGDLIYVDQGPAFVPSCTNPNPRFSNQDYISTCVCPEGEHFGYLPLL